MSLRSPSPGTETTAVVSATIDDLDLPAFHEWVRAHAARLAADDVTTEDALMQLRLGATMGTRLHPTLAGLYLFGHEPQFAMPQLTVVTARFAGQDLTGEIVARGACGGRLTAQVEGVMEFVRSHSRLLVDQVDPRRSSPEFPLRAVREAVVNALVHRDLRSGGPVSVRLFEDRLEVWSPGPAAGLPEPIGHYLRRGGVSLPPNPLVALFARQFGLADQMGRGLPMMRQVVEDEVHGVVAVEGTKDGVLVKIPSALHVQSTRATAMAN